MSTDPLQILINHNEGLLKEKGDRMRTLHWSELKLISILLLLHCPISRLRLGTDSGPSSAATSVEVQDLVLLCSRGAQIDSIELTEFKTFWQIRQCTCTVSACHLAVV